MDMSLPPPRPPHPPNGNSPKWPYWCVNDPGTLTYMWGGGAAAVNHGVRGGHIQPPPPNSLPLCTMNYMTTKSSYSTRGVHQKSLLGLQFSPKYGGGEVYGGRTSNLPPPNSLPLCTMPWAEVGLLNPLKKGGGLLPKRVGSGNCANEGWYGEVGGGGGGCRVRWLGLWCNRPVCPGANASPIPRFLWSVVSGHSPCPPLGHCLPRLSSPPPPPPPPMDTRTGCQR